MSWHAVQVFQAAINLPLCADRSKGSKQAGNCSAVTLLLLCCCHMLPIPHETRFPASTCEGKCTHLQS